MKKVCLFLLTLGILNFNQAFSKEEFKNIGIAKYAVLETTKDNAPLRISPDENAKRVSDLYKDTVLYATQESKNYYKIELEENKTAYINKAQAQLQAVIPEKRQDNIEKVVFKEKKDRFEFEIFTKTLTPFSFEQDGKNLSFKLYDSFFNPINFEGKLKNKINIPNTIENSFSFGYSSPYPLFGYDLEKTDFGYLATIKKAPKLKKNPLKKIKITLDPGHGGTETGVCANGLKEKDINLQITKKLKKELSRSGARVYLTRKKDKKVGLYQRTAFAKEKNSDIFLSIHQNSLPNWKDIDKKYGVGTYYYQEHSKELAKKILTNLEKDTGFRNDGLNYASFAVIRPTSQLGVLIECGYLIKLEEAQKLKDKKFQKTIAKSIAKACRDFLKETYASNISL